MMQESPSKPPPSPIKASPRKSVVSGPVVRNLLQPDERIPLPKKYKFLAEVFDVLEKVRSRRHPFLKTAFFSVECQQFDSGGFSREKIPLLSTLIRRNLFSQI
jgi:hypothetical protein